ncbi:MAG TPA: hypothetical protein VMA34_15825 [Terracidiphilus sp.]|nr:hypothetical protein [Terracidiphilus sp.]
MQEFEALEHFRFCSRGVALPWRESPGYPNRDVGRPAEILFPKVELPVKVSMGGGTSGIPNIGSMAPHLYLTDAGLISHSEVGIPGWSKDDSSAFDFRAGQTFTSVDMLGRPIFSLAVTKEGWLNIARFDGALCTLRPVAEGFDSGARIRGPSFPEKDIEVDDEIEEGVIRESISGKIAAVFHYDKDSGAPLHP